MRNNVLCGAPLNRINRGAAQTTAILKGIRGAPNAISCMAYSRWGSSPLILLKAHEALVVRRICCTLPYYSPSETRVLKLERALREGVKQPLHIPVQTATNQVYAEVDSLHIAVMVNLWAHGQLARLNVTESGQIILRRVEARPRSVAARRFRALLELVEIFRDLSQLDRLQSQPLQAIAYLASLVSLGCIDVVRFRTQLSAARWDPITNAAFPTLHTFTQMVSFDEVVVPPLLPSMLLTSGTSATGSSHISHPLPQRSSLP